MKSIKGFSFQKNTTWDISKPVQKHKFSQEIKNANFMPVLDQNKRALLDGDVGPESYWLFIIIHYSRFETNLTL